MTFNTVFVISVDAVVSIVAAPTTAYTMTDILGTALVPSAQVSLA